MLYSASKYDVYTYNLYGVLSVFGKLHGKNKKLLPGVFIR